MRIEQFLTEHKQKEGGAAFQLENAKLLEVKVDGTVWAKAGAMVAYRGDLKFAQKHGGLGKWLKKSMTGEGAMTMQVTGRGVLYLADKAKEVHILELAGEDAISVNGNDILAFQETVQWDIQMMRKAAGLAAGGLFNVQLRGAGLIAFTTHGRPIVLETPAVTDPQATVAWSANAQPDFRTDINLGTLFGKSSGETFQMDFRQAGGFVVVQPYEEGGAAPS
ncbi:MAG TPA: AIM24 family protein [Rhodothermales bacterium]|nr:AIM24 family protein [Rhodothermales bacterium]